MVAELMSQIFSLKTLKTRIKDREKLFASVKEQNVHGVPCIQYILLHLVE